MKQPNNDNRSRALGFGAVAEIYDRSRPTYPPEMIAELLAAGPSDILDVGCGTGKAARLLAGAGRKVLGVAPDARMAAVARGHGIDVEIGEFESWDAAGRRFDLLVSGQAWHWVDPVAGATKAAEVLRPGGRFAAFWNEMYHSAPVRAVFDEVYGRNAPELLTSSLPLGIGTPDTGRDPAGEALAAGLFDEVTAGKRTWYEWSAEYTPEGWAEVVGTHSDHLQLDADVRRRLLDELTVALAALGDRFEVSFRTELLTAIRR